MRCEHPVVDLAICVKSRFDIATPGTTTTGVIVRRDEIQICSRDDVLRRTSVDAEYASFEVFISSSVA